MRTLLAVLVLCLAGCGETERCRELKSILAAPEERIFPEGSHKGAELFGKTNPSSQGYTTHDRARLELKSMTIPCKP